jgi:membrane protein implicated in regulation of membrane protease activity
MQYRLFRLQPNTWQGRIGVVLAFALAMGLAAAFVILTLGIAILLLPVVAVVVALGWWRLRKIEAAMRDEASRRDAGDDGRVIEIDYQVVGDPDARRR